MFGVRRLSRITLPAVAFAAVAGAALLAASALAAGMSHTSKPFKGVKANTGRVTHSVQAGRDVLTLSDNFKVPDAPAPHWQIVDSRGQAFLLQRVMIKGDKLNKSITLPDYISDIAKVQIWCAWAEVLLGETTFNSVIPLQRGNGGMKSHTSSMFQGAKANTGYAIHSHENGQSRLAVSDDFVVPDTPAPHWQVVDSRGRVYLLQRLDIKDGKFNRSIIVPAYVPDIAKVQIWCAWAETLLGEASFEMPVR